MVLIMKKVEKLTQLSHINKDNEIKKVYINMETKQFYVKDAQGNKTIVNNRNTTHVSNIDKKTHKIKSSHYEDDIVYGLNDFGYPNEYWD